jgi:hypothetical protein
MEISLKWPVTVLLAVILFYPPFFRGLFFPGDQLLAFVATGVVGILWWAEKRQRRDGGFLERPMDYAVLAVFGAYLLSSFVAVNLRGAIQDVLLYLALFVIYWLAADLAKERRIMSVFLHTLFFSAVGVAVVGLGSALGLINYPGAFVGGRINSSLQYPDSLAAYMLGATILGVVLWELAPAKRWYRYLYPAGGALAVINFLLAYSLGADLVLPILLVAVFFVLPGLI